MTVFQGLHQPTEGSILSICEEIEAKLSSIAAMQEKDVRYKSRRGGRISAWPCCWSGPRVRRIVIPGGDAKAKGRL